MSDRSLLFSLLHSVRRRYWRLAGPRTVGVRGVVLDGDGRVLLVRHSYGGLGWHLPGGGVKRREHLADAVVRELREEAGIVTAPAGLELFGAYSNLFEGKSDYIAVFTIRDWHQVPSADGEIIAWEFFDPAAPPSGASPGTLRRLAELTGTSARGSVW